MKYNGTTLTEALYGVKYDPKHPYAAEFKEQEKELERRLWAEIVRLALVDRD